MKLHPKKSMKKQVSHGYNLNSASDTQFSQLQLHRHTKYDESVPNLYHLKRYPRQYQYHTYAMVLDGMESCKYIH